MSLIEKKNQCYNFITNGQLNSDGRHITTDVVNGIPLGLRRYSMNVASGLY